MVRALWYLVCLTPLVAMATPPPIEAYGQRATIRSMAISPDGTLLAFLQRRNNEEAMVVYRFGEGMVGGVNTSDIKAGNLFFYDNNHVILKASKTTRMIAVREKFEYSAAFSYDIEKNNVRQLLIGSKHLYPAQGGIGKIIGSYQGKYVLMPAFSGSFGDDKPPFSVFRVNLTNGKGRIIHHGTSKTRDWIVEDDGTVVMREEYDDEQQRYAIYSNISDSELLLYEQKNAALPPLDVVGMTADQDALVVFSEAGDVDVIRQLDFDGEWSKPMFQREAKEVERVILDDQRRLLGVQYSGMRPEYEFTDPLMNRHAAAMVERFSPAAVYIIDASQDLQRIVLKVSGSRQPDSYYVFDRSDMTISHVANGRAGIAAESVAPVKSVKYEARDGLSIPAVLTLPPGVEAKNLAMIVMPHGGPEAYDRIGFDWMAQFFASRGYAVLQPNFRGSSGFGHHFTLAGRGQWGKKMQDDISDGVEAMINSGYADPDRVCIVGASYGGYAALAGGAYTPELYRCIAAIAPVSDLPKMLSREMQYSGAKSWVYRYWTKLIGDRKQDREALKQVSPARAASQFKAPVLLIHGTDDTVVPINQSRVMAKALKQAGQPHEFIRLKHGDHWLLDNQSRLQTLIALERFVHQHLGKPEATTQVEAGR